MKETLLNVFVFLLFLLAVIPTSAAPFRQRGPGMMDRFDGPPRVIAINRRPNIFEAIKNFFKYLSFGARINGTISNINNGVLTVKNIDGKNYQVFLAKDTNLSRNFWGGISPENLSIGDQLVILGQWKDKNKNQINAKMIRDLSIMKRHDVFSGNVILSTEPVLIIGDHRHNNQTVITDPKTNFFNRNQKPILFKDIQENDSVRVNGFWDINRNEITEVNRIDDFSVPVPQ